MIDLLQYPELLKFLSRAHRLKGLLLGRDSGAARAQEHRAAFYEKLWQDAAASLGARIAPLGCGLYEISAGGKRARVFQNHSPLDDEVTLLLAGNKPLVNRLLAKENLPTPEHAEFTLESINRAAAFLRRAGKDCVVKPAKDTGGGRGVTTGIASRSMLARAAVIAASYSKDLLIEEQAQGENYRLLYLDGVLLDAVIRRAPTVTGDGRSSVRRLVELANGERLARGASLAQSLLTIDLDMKRTLAKQGLSLDSKPQSGRIVRVKTVINENCAEENQAAARLLCDSIIEAGAKAARAIGARLAGVDIITTDPSVALEQSGGVILEVNTTPGYYYHYNRREEPFPVAARVLESLLETGGAAFDKKLDALHRSKALTV